MRNQILLVFTISLFFLLPYSIAQDNTTPETESRVPALENFHEVMYPIWHMEFPEKNYEALRGHLAEVQKLAGEIYTAPLPGILRDKREKWEKGLIDFKNAVNKYAESTEGTKDEELLNSVEKLHPSYEGLVRIIRPVLKEIDLFHQLLYVYYHKYLPGNDFEAIKSNSTELSARAGAIINAKLPARLSSKTEKFNLSSKELLKATRELEKIDPVKDSQLAQKTIEKIHTRYQELEAIF